MAHWCDIVLVLSSCQRLRVTVAMWKTPGGHAPLSLKVDRVL